MKAVFLAAGVGTRIIDDIGQQPKSLLEVNGQPMLLHTVELMQKNNIETILITGFKHQMIDAVLQGRDVKVYYNPFFRSTNSMGSLWFARDEFDTEEILVANADVYYTQELIDIIKSCDYDNFMLYDRSRTMVGDWFFHSENDVLMRQGKGLLPVEDRTGEYVGLAGLRGAGSGNSGIASVL